MIPAQSKTKPLRGTIIMVVILVILIILAAAFGWWRARQASGDVPFANLMDRVDHITINNGDQKIDLVQNDTNWSVASANNQIANQSYISTILTTLPDMVVKEIVSRNPDKQSTYGFPDQAREVKLQSGDKVLADFWVGKPGPSWPSAYFRWHDSNDIYLVAANLSQMFGYQEWRDLHIASIPQGNIKSLTWSNGITVEKQDGGWQATMPQPFQVADDKLKTVLDNLSELNGRGISDQSVVDLNPAEMTFGLTVITTDDQQQQFGFWREDDMEGGDYHYLVTYSGKNMVYEMSKYVAENMEKTAASLQ